MDTTIIGRDSPRMQNIVSMHEFMHESMQVTCQVFERPSPELARAFPEWLAGFFGLDAKEATLRLEARWSPLQTSPLKELVKLLLPVEEFFLCIVDQSDELAKKTSSVSPLSYSLVWFTPVGKSLDPKTRQPKDQQFMLAAPPRFSIVDALSEYVEPTPLMIEFFTHFHLLSDPPPYSGTFLSPLLWKQSADRMHLAEYRGTQEWKSAVPIYHADNGDYVLLSTEGKVAWAQMETQRVVPLKDDFEAFIQHYLAYSRFSWPFDSWGAKGVLKLEL